VPRSTCAQVSAIASEILSPVCVRNSKKEAPVGRQSGEQERQVGARQSLRVLVVGLSARGCGDAHTVDRVRAKQPVLNGGREHGRERGPDALHRRRRHAIVPQCREQLAHIGRLNVGQPPRPPPRERVLLDAVPVQLA